MPRRQFLLTWAAAAALLFAYSPARADKVTIKLGTLAPEGSVWHEGLKELAQRWKEASGGLVQVRIFAGGVAGDESDMVRKMRIGQLNAAALSAVGLHDIEGSPQLLAMPGLIQTQAEWEHVYGAMAPSFDERFVERGFVPLLWADTGWVYLFVDRPVARVSDFDGLKVFTWAGDPGAAEAWRTFGFQPVVLSATDLSTSLSTGMVDGFAATPIIAFTSRLFERATYMIDVPWGHLPGSTVVAKATWEKIPAELRPKLMAIAREIGARIDAAGEKASQESVALMKKRGLTVVTFDEANRREWMARAKRSWAPLLGGADSKAVFEQIQQARETFRARAK